jgi:hypothetical protein
VFSVDDGACDSPVVGRIRWEDGDTVQTGLGWSACDPPVVGRSRREDGTVQTGLGRS